MHQKRLNTHGITHFILPLFITVVIASLGVYFLVNAHAASRKTKRYTITERKAFARVAYGYWAEHDDGGRNLSPGDGPISIQYVACQPNRVKIKYFSKDFGPTNYTNFHTDRATGDTLGFAPIGGAKPSVLSSGGGDVVVKELAKSLAEVTGQKITSASFPKCAMWLNLDPTYAGFNNNRELACVTYLHLYGHLLGYRHSTSDIHSVMFEPGENGFADFGGSRLSNDDKAKLIINNFRYVGGHSSTCHVLFGNGPALPPI